MNGDGAWTYLLLSFAAAGLVGALCGSAGVWLVLRRQALVGDAVAHSTLAGIAGAFLLSGQQDPLVLLAGALATGLASMGCLELLARDGRIRPDAALALTLSSFFGLGTVLMGWVSSSPSGAQAGLSGFLLGNAAGVRGADVALLAAVAGVAAAAMPAVYRALVLSTFDPTMARLAGWRPHAVRLGLLLALTVVIVLSVRLVGVVMVSAMLVIPAQTGLVRARSAAAAMAVAGVCGAVAALAGTAVSVQFSGVATGPVMVVSAAVLLLAESLRWRLSHGRWR